MSESTNFLTTVTVTSFYIPESTSSQISSSSPSKKNFAALAAGGAVGGCALTCIIGWILFLIWKRRHPHRWHGRTDAENFPGWRRSTVSRLQETEQKRDSDFVERAPSRKSTALLRSTSVRPSMEKTSSDLMPTSPRPLPSLPSAPDLVSECATAFLALGLDESPAEGSSQNPLSVKAYSKRSSKKKRSIQLPAEVSLNDRASLSSRGSSQYTSSSYYRPGSATSQNKPSLPPPKHTRASSQGSIVIPAASWHGHGPSKVHSSWHGPLPFQYQPPPSSWSGHSPPYGSSSSQKPNLTTPTPPTSWTGHQPKFFIQEPSPIHRPSSALPPTTLVDDEELEPPRRLTVTNPDAASLNGSKENLPPATP